MIDGLRSKYGDLSPLCLSVGLFRKSGCVLYRRPAVQSFVRVNDRVEREMETSLILEGESFGNCRTLLK